MTKQQYRLRVQAAAIIWAADHEGRASHMAEVSGDDVITCACKYISGTVRRMITTGQARHVAEALDMIEARQSGDDGTYDGVASELSRQVARINAVNMRDSGGRVEAVGHRHRRPHSRNYGRVLGSLYCQYEEHMAGYMIAAEASPQYAYSSSAEADIRAYVREYVSRLSATAQRTISKLREYNGDVDALTTRAARTSSDASVRRLSRSIRYLVTGWPGARLTASEYVHMIRRYA